MNYLHEHKNFKHLLKNRMLRPTFVVKNDYGYKRSIGDSFTSIFTGGIHVYFGLDNGVGMFSDARRLHAKVYLLTLAGEIEVKQEDFFNGF